MGALFEWFFAALVGVLAALLAFAYLSAVALLFSISAPMAIVITAVFFLAVVFVKERVL